MFKSGLGAKHFKLDIANTSPVGTECFVIGFLDDLPAHAILTVHMAVSMSAEINLDSQCSLADVF